MPIKSRSPPATKGQSTESISYTKSTKPTHKSQNKPISKGWPAITTGTDTFKKNADPNQQKT